MQSQTASPARCQTAFPIGRERAHACCVPPIHCHEEQSAAEVLVPPRMRRRWGISLHIPLLWPVVVDAGHDEKELLSALEET